MIRVGIVGLGAMGQNHVRIYSKLQCNITGVVDVDSCVRTVVYACNQKVYRVGVELHYGQLDAIGGGALDAKACELAVDVNFIAY